MVTGSQHDSSGEWRCTSETQPAWDECDIGFVRLSFSDWCPGAGDYCNNDMAADWISSVAKASKRDQGWVSAGASSSSSLVQEMPAFTLLLVFFFNHKEMHHLQHTGWPNKYRSYTWNSKKTGIFFWWKNLFICSYVYKARLRMLLDVRHCPSGEVFPEPVGILWGKWTG